MADTKMTDDKLFALVQSEITSAVGYDSSQLAKRRAEAIQYYEGDPSIIEHEDNFSSQTSTDLADHLGWILPSLMRVFASSDTLGEYETKYPRPGEDKKAEEERKNTITEQVNTLFWTELDGYKKLLISFKEGLLFGNGIYKHWWDDTPEYKTNTYTNVSVMDLANFGEGDEFEIVEFTENEDEDGNTISYDCTVKQKISDGKLCFENIPPEEFLINKDATSIKDAYFLGHRYRASRAELIERNYDKAKVMKIGVEDQIKSSDEYQQRHDKDQTNNHEPDNPLMERVEVYECYIRCDYNNDGVTEWRRVDVGGLGGSRLTLSNDEWDDDICFSEIVPDPRPHRWDGLSLYDDLKPIQDVKTVLIRQTLDNLYQVNNPMREVLENQVNNMDALETPQVGGYVSVKQLGAVKDIPVPFVANQSFQMLEYLDALAEKRTGVSRQSMALDPEALSNQTATGVQAAQASSYAKTELYARNIASGLADLLRALYRLLVKNQEQARFVKVKGEWQQMAPSTWDDDMDVKINVGLGSGNKDADVSLMSNVIQKQEAILMQLGPSNPLVGFEEYQDALHKLFELAGIRNPERFIKDVSPETLQEHAQSQQQQPDPKLIEVQKKAELDQMKTQADIQAKREENAMALQLQREKNAAEILAMREKGAAELEIKRLESEQKSQLEAQQALQNAELRREEMLLEAQLTAQANAMNAHHQPDTNLDQP